jgi:hypothetical protein
MVAILQAAAWVIWRIVRKDVKLAMIRPKGSAGLVNGMAKTFQCGIPGKAHSSSSS